MTYTIEEQAANREKWVAALRSGEFRQAQEALMNEVWADEELQGVGYCCLGVLCEVFKRETGEGYWDTENASTIPDTAFIVDEEFDGAMHDTNIQPPPAVAEWVGMIDPTSRYGSGEVDHVTAIMKPRPSLAHANDSGDVDFEGIARIIESEPEGLFVS